MDIHILSGDGRGQWTMVCHFAVPDILNEVGIGYRQVLINSGLGGMSQMVEGTGPGQISTAELAQIEAGEIYEYVQSWPAESGATTNAEMLADVRAEYARLQPFVLIKLQERLRYYGWAGAAEVE